MSETIILYDLPTTIPGRGLSPSASVTRYCLHYKGLPHKTAWVEFPDIEALSKKIGTLPTSIKNGKPHYTLPAIYDPKTNTALADSALIAEYLDATYPDTPTLFPPGTRALQHAFVFAFMQAAVSGLAQLVLPAVKTLVNPPSQAHWRRKHEITFGKKLEDIAPTGKAAEEEWAKVKAGFDIVDGWWQKGKVDGPYLLGQEPGFADLVVVAYVSWCKGLWGVDSPQWKDIRSWNGGRWDTLIKNLEKYETIV